jgi:hypothetical protein
MGKWDERPWVYIWIREQRRVRLVKGVAIIVELRAGVGSGGACIGGNVMLG